jgi:hypothetical protein
MYACEIYLNCIYIHVHIYMHITHVPVCDITTSDLKLRYNPQSILDGSGARMKRRIIRIGRQGLYSPLYRPPGGWGGGAYKE